MKFRRHDAMTDEYGFGIEAGFRLLGLAVGHEVLQPAERLGLALRRGSQGSALPGGYTY